MGRLLNIYSYAIQYLKSCGIWCVHYLGFIGSCCVVSWNFWHVGQTSSTDLDLRCFGEWFLIVLCESFGGRNIRTFDGNERLIHELKLLFFQTLFDWANDTGVFTFIYLLNMLDFCTFIVMQEHNQKLFQYFILDFQWIISYCNLVICLVWIGIWVWLGLVV